MNVFEETRKLYNEYGLHDWTYRFGKSKTSFGVCFPTLKVIEYSEHILLHDDETILETVRHEVAHAIAFSQGSCGHDKIWGDIFVGLGGSGERVASKSLVGTKLWTTSCSCGDFTINRHRRTKNAFCPKCTMALIWTNNKTGESGLFLDCPDGVTIRNRMYMAPVGMVWVSTLTPWLDPKEYSYNSSVLLAMSLGFTTDKLTVRGN